MAKFAISDRSETLWQLDSATPSQLPVSVHKNAKQNAFAYESLALASDKEFYSISSSPVSGGVASNIYKTQGPLADLLIYDATGKSFQPQRVRVRTVAPNKERVYFSTTLIDANGNTYSGRCDSIYYLENGVAILYAQIDHTQLTFPDPTNPAGPLWSWWDGDFDFGDGDTLYVSTGTLSAVCGDKEEPMIVGVYRFDGAYADSLVGFPQCIHQTQAPVYGLCYRSPAILYFLRDKNVIWKLDLGAMTESVEGKFTLPGANVWDANDLVEVGAGVETYLWPYIGALSKWLLAAGHWMWSMGNAAELRLRHLMRSRDKR